METTVRTFGPTQKAKGKSRRWENVSASSSTSPKRVTNKIIWKCFHFFSPFPTDKNKKQKSDILNFLVVCFTICFYYSALLLSHSLKFHCFSIFYFISFAFLASQQISRSNRVLLIFFFILLFPSKLMSLTLNSIISFRVAFECWPEL